MEHFLEFILSSFWMGAFMRTFIIGFFFAVILILIAVVVKVSSGEYHWRKLSEKEEKEKRKGKRKIKNRKKKEKKMKEDSDGSYVLRVLRKEIREGIDAGKDVSKLKFEYECFYNYFSAVEKLFQRACRVLDDMKILKIKTKSVLDMGVSGCDIKFMGELQEVSSLEVLVGEVVTLERVLEAFKRELKE